MDCISSKHSVTSSARQILHMGLVIGLVLISTHIDAIHARSVSNVDDIFSDPVVKRNTWWTKKSLDALDTIPRANNNVERTKTSDCQEAVEVYACYITKCVPPYVTCARQTTGSELFEACQILHKLCASSCSNGAPEMEVLSWTSPIPV